MYSQNNEDTLIAHYFRDQPGTLLSLGENDGKTLSNSRLLIERGWRGVLVEPAPTAYVKLKQLYHKNEKTCLFNVAIGSKTQVVNFYTMGDHLGKGDTDLLSTLDPEEMKRWPGTPFYKIEVEVWRFSRLLEFSPWKTFDFISIDCEGLDLEIMGQIDFDAVGCKCVCVEFNGKDKEKFDEIADLYRFTLMHRNGENLIYVR